MALIPDGGGAKKPVGGQEVLEPPAPEFYTSGTASSWSSSSSFTPVLPPVLEWLAEQRARREANRTAAQAIINSILETAPRALPSSWKTLPGMEEGGVADILMGIISGKGTAEAGKLLAPYRALERMRVPISQLQDLMEPSAESELPGALGAAKKIIDALKLIQTGASSSGSHAEDISQVSPDSGGGGSSSIEDIQAAMIQLLQHLAPQAGTEDTPQYFFDPATGEIIQR